LQTRRPRQRSSRPLPGRHIEALTPQVRIFPAEAARDVSPGADRASATGRSPGGQFEVERATSARSSRLRGIGKNLETRKTSSRRPAIASATTQQCRTSGRCRYGHAQIKTPRSRDCSGASATLNVPGSLITATSRFRTGTDAVPCCPSS